jgi:hypothetical protein
MKNSDGFSADIEQYRTGGIETVIIDTENYDHPNMFVKSAFVSRDPIEKRLDWLLSFPKEFTSEVDVDDIEKAYQKIDEIISKPNKRVELDEMIQHMDKWNISHEIQINVLRYTYPMRQEIPMWNKVLNNLLVKLEDNKLNAKEMLLGML